MVRLAIVLLVVFWTTVTAGSLLWEVIDPASISAQPQPQALPSGLREETAPPSATAATAAGEPTLAELSPGLRASLRAQITEDGKSGAPVDLTRSPVAAPVDSPPPATAQPGPAASPIGTPAVEDAAGTTPMAVRPRPRPQQSAVMSAPTSVSVPEKRPAVPDPNGGQQIAEAQTLLAALGYNVGSVDGRMGSRTEAALKAYEKKSGLKVDGRVDDQLLARLRSETRATPRANEATANEPPSPRPHPSLTGRVLGGVQRLIGHDFNSVAAPDELVAYCDDRGDEWVYDRGLDKMRSCTDVVGAPKVAVRPLPGDH